LCIFRLKVLRRRVEILMMVVIIFFGAWITLALALAVPVGRLCAVRANG